MRVCARPCSKPTYLCLDELRADPNLARLLPPEVAYRFHALPVAEQDGHITVVMADPEDSEALSTIAGLLGREPCIVQGDARTIDASLARVWGRQQGGLRLLVCATGGAGIEGLGAYARSLGALLNAEVKDADCERGLEAPPGRYGEPADDLLLLGDADCPLIAPWLAGTSWPGIVPSLLLAPRPRWPLTRILLIVGGEEVDAAADWVLRLAVPADSTVDVLAVVPQLTALHEQHGAASPGLGHLRQGLPALLSGGTALGQELQLVARQLQEQELRGSLRMRQGPLEWQIRRELAEDHDLVVMGLEPGQDGQGASGDLAVALLRWTDCPTLIVRPRSR